MWTRKFQCTQSFVLFFSLLFACLMCYLWVDAAKDRDNYKRYYEYFQEMDKQKAESSILRFFVYNVFNRLVILHENQLFSRHQQYLNYFFEHHPTISYLCL